MTGRSNPTRPSTAPRTIAPINIELFSCSGGLAEGFRRAGVHFDVAIDFDADHCSSYEANLGHRPVRMDVRDLLRLVQLGAARPEVDLLVADPPCTPWSRAGKRRGTADERDMLVVTCELIAALQPRRYLIGNIPGLDDSTNLPVVQRTIGALAAHGYCTADFAQLDAANYGVPQHRIRPWWFGHLVGPCIQWPAPTHGDPEWLTTGTLPGIQPLRPWVTCRTALAHLGPDELGRPVKVRRRAQHCAQHGSVPERPARTLGTSNLSDGNVLVARRAVRATTILVADPHHPPSYIDEPAMTVRAGSGGGANRALQLNGDTGRVRKRPPSTQVPQSARTMSPDRPATTVQAREDRLGSGSPVLEWPWDRPATTVTGRPGLAPPGHHDEAFATLALPDAIQLSERAAAILQGFEDGWVFSGRTKRVRWSQIGQAVPPAFAEAVARAVVAQDRAADVAELGRALEASP